MNQAVGAVAESGSEDVRPAAAANLRCWTSTRSVVMSGGAVMPRRTWLMSSVKNPEAGFVAGLRTQNGE